MKFMRPKSLYLI